jgi:hypothetical protein
VLDSIDHATIAGYNFIQDTLVVSLENQGVIETRKFKINDSLIANLKDRHFFKITNFKALHYHVLDNPNTIYEYEHIKIINKNGLQLTCQINDVEVWRKSVTIWFFKSIGMSGYGYQNPKLSVDLKKVIVSYLDPSLMYKTNSILEIDVETGTVINKIKNSENPSYSNDSQLILYKNKNGIFCVFDCKSKKSTEFYGWKCCFWLLKS